jgi:hypothetical protein
MESEMSWKIFEERAPQMAALGIERLNRKIAYPSTLRKDDSPRLHPIPPFISDGMLFMFTEPSSPKIRDLRRDDRYTLHCSVDRKEGEPFIEFLVSGTAQVIKDLTARQQAAEEIAASPVVTDEYILFEFHVDHVLVVEYDRVGQLISGSRRLQQCCPTVVVIGYYPCSIASRYRKDGQ